MNARLQDIRFHIVGGLIAMAFIITKPALALAHAGHKDEGGIDMVTTMQVAGVMAVIGIGYFVVSRRAKSHEEDRQA